MHRDRKKIHNQLYKYRKKRRLLKDEYDKLGGRGYLNYYLSIEICNEMIIKLENELKIINHEI